MDGVVGRNYERSFLPDREEIWGFRGAARYAKVGGDTGLNYFVDQNNAYASDLNDGENPETPFLTIAAAIAASNATVDWGATPKVYNTIWVSPGVYDENLTPAYYARIIGTGQLGTDTAAEIHPTAGSAMAGTFLGSVLINMRLESETAVPVIDLGIANNSAIFNCEIVKGIADLATMGIQTDNATHLMIVGNRFISGVTDFGIGIQCLGGADRYLHASYIYDNVIFATTTGIDIAAACTATGTVIKNNVIARPTTGISDQNGNTWLIDNWISASVDAINHVATATHSIANHVLDNAVGAVEAAGTD
jgi:hypothetical protein